MSVYVIQTIFRFSELLHKINGDGQIESWQFDS